MSLIAVATLRTDIRTVTNRDSDQRVTDGQLDTFIDKEYKNLRRQLSERLRSPFSKFDDSFRLFDSQTTIKKPTDFETFCRFEEWFQGAWEPLDVSKAFNPSDAHWREFREEGDFFILTPASGESNVDGYYRLTYVPILTAGYTSVDLPDGFEVVLVERCAVRVRNRLEEDPRPHSILAKEVWNELFPTYQRRYGWHLRNGIRERRSARSYFDAGTSVPPTPEPTNLVAVAGGSNVVLTWSAVPGADLYRIYRSPTPYAGFTEINTVTAPTVSFDDTPLAPGTYYHVVKADRYGVTGAPSNQTVADV